MIFEKQIVNIYKSMMHTRCDDTETVFYFSPQDFPGLRSTAFNFTSSMGHALCGYLYEYSEPNESRLIVFDHGMGGGHRAYMKEIEMLARHGYRVLAYDHTGCMESGGESTNGLAQSLCDLNDCINVVKSSPRFSNTDISVVGHSWGAYSTMNISALHPEISHIVALCGFVSVNEMVGTFFSGMMKGYRRPIMALEEKCNPSFVKYSAVNTLSASDVKALLIYSDNDTLCKRVHYDIMKDALEGKENAELILVEGKGHNPNYTTDAVGLLAEFVAARARLTKKKNVTAEEKSKFVKSFNWDKMTEQDDAVWDKILSHLKK